MERAAQAEQVNHHRVSTASPCRRQVGHAGGCEAGVGKRDDLVAARVVLAGWGVSVVPRLLVEGLMEQGLLQDVAPGHVLPIQLYWHCWTLESEVLDALSAKGAEADEAAEASVRRKVKTLLARFPIYQ